MNNFIWMVLVVVYALLLIFYYRSLGEKYTKLERANMMNSFGKGLRKEASGGNVFAILLLVMLYGMVLLTFIKIVVNLF
jgi:hypothetical protein